MRMCAILVGAAATVALHAPVRASGLTTDESLLHDDVLTRAEQYLSRFVETFSSVLWRERYTQEDRVQQRFGSSGARVMRLAERREIQSDMLLLWIPREQNWIAVRDVIAVDGEPPAPSEARLGAALARQNVSLDDLRTLAAENGRFNIGRILRTFNEPTLTLLFLSERNRDRFRFRRVRDAEVGGRAAAVYEFDERGRPTIVRSDGGRDIPSHGAVWIDAESGQVLQTLLELTDKRTGVTGRMTVRYGPHAGFDVLVPLEMRETYKADAAEEVTTVAAYSDFRKFETAARIIHKWRR